MPNGAGELPLIYASLGQLLRCGFSWSSIGAAETITMACGRVGLLAAGSPHQEAESHCVTIWRYGLVALVGFGGENFCHAKLITQWLVLVDSQAFQLFNRA